MLELVIQCVAQGKRKGVVKFEGNKPKRLHQHQSHESDSKPMQEKEEEGEEERQLGGENKRKMPQTSESDIGKIRCVSVLLSNVKTFDAGESTES